MQPKTQGRWHTESKSDGSTWLIGPDPADGEPVCIAAFEMEADAEYVAKLHNRHRKIRTLRDRHTTD